MTEQISNRKRGARSKYFRIKFLVFLFSEWSISMQKYTIAVIVVNVKIVTPFSVDKETMLFINEFLSKNGIINVNQIAYSIATTINLFSDETFFRQRKTVTKIIAKLNHQKLNKK